MGTKCITRKWIILAASVLLHLITFGVTQSFGVLYTELLLYFKDGKGTTGWIPSLNSGLLLGLGPLASILERKTSCRFVCILGSLLISGGLASSLFVDDLRILYLTYGVVAGSGNGMVLLAASEIINQNFDKHCKLAFGLASAGGSMGVVVMPPLATFLIESYGWRGTLLIMAGLCLQGVVCGAMFPVKVSRSLTQTETDTEKDENKYNLRQQIRSILLQYDFVLFCAASTVACVGYLIPFVMAPDAAVNHGLSSYEAAFVITAAGITGMIARIVAGGLSQIKRVDVIIVHGLILFCGSGLTVALVFIKSTTMFMIYGGGLGIYIGIFAALQTVITVEIVNKDRFSLAFGILCFFHGVAMTLGPPIAGWIADYSGRYDEAFYFTAVMYFLGGVITFGIPFRRTYRGSKPHDDTYGQEKGTNIDCVKLEVFNAK